MSEPNQRSSPLSHMTRANSPNEPAPDDVTQSFYHENKRTTSVPTKSGTDVAIRPHSRSDSLHETSRPSSRTSEKTEDMDHADAELMKKYAATPSAAELDIPARKIQKPTVESLSEAFNPHKPFKMAAPTNFSKKPHPKSIQSSQPISIASFEKSNQEHQASARRIEEGHHIAIIPQAPAELKRDVHSDGSQLFQHMPEPRIQKTASKSRATSSSRPRPDPSAVKVQKQTGRSSPVRQNATVDLSHTDMQTVEGPVLKRTVAVVNRASATQAPLKQNNFVEETINADIPPVAVSDTEDIFSITKEAPVSPTGVLAAPTSPRSEQQHSIIGEEVHVQPQILRADLIDVPMQDLTEKDLYRTESLNPQACSVVHAEPPEDCTGDLQEGHHVEVQLPLEEEHVGEDHHLLKDQHSTEESQPGPSNLQTEATHGTPNEVRGIQHPPTPPDTITLDLTEKQQPLHGVTDRCGLTRVTKQKTKPSPSGPTARKTSSKLRLGSLPYTATQLYQLAEYIKEKERLEEKQGWVRDLAAKQAELEQANQHNLSLETECAELKTSLEKHAGLAEKLKAVILAFNGFGHDMKALQKTRARHDREFSQLKTQLNNDLDTATKITEGIKKIDKLRAKSLSMLMDCKSLIDSLKREKSDLQRRLAETSKTLVQEKERQAAFDKRLQDLQQERNSGDDDLNGRTSKLSDQLSDFKTLIEQSASMSATFSREHLESMKKEYATLTEQVRSSGTNTETIKTSLDQLSTGLQKYIEDTKTANTESTKAHAEAHTKAENKIVAVLEEIKSGFKDREDLAEKNAVLRETISQEKQKFESSTKEISKLEIDMKQKNNDEAVLKQKIEELQTSQVVLQSEKASAEENKAKLSALTTSEGKLKQEIERLKSEKAESIASIASIDEQKKTLQHDKAELQGQIRETTKRLEEARSAAPDFSIERSRIEAKAKQQVDEAIADSHVQARKLAINFGNQKLRLEKKKEEVDLALVAKENTIKDLQSQLESLKQEFGNRSLASWSDEVKHKDAEIKRLDADSTAAHGQVKNLQQKLDEALQSTQSSAQEQLERLQEKDTQVKLLGDANTKTQNKVESLQQKLLEADRSRQACDKAHQEDATRKSQEAKDLLKDTETRLSEADSAKRAVDTKLIDLEKRTNDEAEHRQKQIETLQRSLEDANSRLKETEERLDQQQVVIGQKDLDIEKLKQDHVKAVPPTVEVPNSLSQENVGTQASASPAKRTRRAINRNHRSTSKATSSTSPVEATQLTSDVPESTQPRGAGSSIFGPYTKSSISGHHALGRDETQPDDDDMLDMDNPELRFAKSNSRPSTSQSESQKALSLGSQEALDAEGVRSRRQIRTDFEFHSQTHVSSSASPSEVNELDKTNQEAAQVQTQVSQSQNRINASQQNSLGMSALKLNTQEEQNSLDLSVQDDLIDSSQPGLETPMKTNGKNLQGVGRKLTPRPESQPRSQSKAGALPSASKARLAKGAAANSQDKKVSALSSGPHNFKPGGSGKGKGKRVSYADEEDDDEYSVPSSSGRGGLSPAKRRAAQSTKINKRVRTETSTSTLSSNQRSATSTPRRSQTTAKSSSLNRAPPSTQETVTPAPPRRRSGRTNKEQNMMSRFNDEISSPHATRRG